MTRKITRMTLMAVTAWMAGFASADVPIVSYALEDAAFQAAMQMDASPKVKGVVTNIAFVKLWHDDGKKSVDPTGNDALVFETALAATPGSLNFVVHAGHEADWKLIDEIFDQAADFSSWDPKTCPKLKQLKLCDAILTAHLMSLHVETNAKALTVRLALRLIKVSTAEEIWSGVVEGSYSDPGPDNEQVSPNWRKALEACAADAVAKLPDGLDGYGLLILPMEGKCSKAFGQVFLNALTAQGKQDRIRVYDLPNGSASDRLLARFLRERSGSGAAIGNSVLRQIEKLAGGRGIKTGRLALMSGRVSIAGGESSAQLDANGLPIGFLLGSQSSDEQKRYDVTADIKFRDVNEHFRLIASIGANGGYEVPEKPLFGRLEKETKEFAQSLDLGTVTMIVIGALLVLVFLWLALKILKSITRAR